MLKKFAGKNKKPSAQATSSQAEERAASPQTATDDERLVSEPETVGLPSWRSRWGVLDWASIVMALASVGLIAVAPWITEHTVGSVMHEILWDLHPWPI